MKLIRAFQAMTWDVLNARLKTVLPEDYQECYEQVQPVSMGSAGLKYDSDGKVAWDDIWDSFCDLAMAGGPPHKGRLLEPGSKEEITAMPEEYGRVVEEIRRGIRLVALLPTRRAPVDGWIRVDCASTAKADWLVRAIAMENISVRSSDTTLELPAAPHYRVEKEIKNVITSVAKTCHYWDDHMPLWQQSAIRELFEQMLTEAPFVQPSLKGTVSNSEYERASQHLATSILESTGLRQSSHRYFGWIGFECAGVAAAVWMMRALVACNVLSRREEATLFVPVNPSDDRNSSTVAQAVATVFRLAVDRRIV